MNRNLCRFYLAIMKFQHRYDVLVSRMYGRYRMDILRRMFVGGHKRFCRYRSKHDYYYTKWVEEVLR